MPFDMNDLDALKRNDEEAWNRAYPALWQIAVETANKYMRPSLRKITRDQIERTLRHDAAVLEYYPQPPPITLRWKASTRRETGIVHTPDFFVFREDTCGPVECKPQDKLEQLILTAPDRFQRDEGGRWRCEPGERVAKEYGFFYRVWSTAELNPTSLRNLRFLQDYFDPDYPETPLKAGFQIVEAVKRQAGLSVADLVRRLSDAGYDEVYRLIADGDVYAGLETDLLAQPCDVRVYADSTSARAYALVLSERVQPPVRRLSHQLRTNLAMAQFERNLPVQTVGPDATSPSLEAKEMLTASTEAELAVANRRMELLRGTSSPQSAQVSSRTLDRWREHYGRAELRYGCGYLGLLPRYRYAGNREPRYPAEVYSTADQVIESEYGSGRVSTKRLLHAHSRRVLAFHLSFEKPSYRSCMMLFRDCVRRHNRLPDSVMVDAAREFRSVFFESLAAVYSVIIKYRLTAGARFGSVIERHFGTLQPQLFAHLAGAAVPLDDEDGQAVAVRSRQAAVWTLDRLHELLERYFFEIYDHQVHGSLGMSPA